MQQKDIVRPSNAERETCKEVIGKFKGTCEKKCGGLRCYSWLMRPGLAWTDQQIANAFCCRTNSVESIRQRFVERGFQQTLE